MGHTPRTNSPLKIGFVLDDTLDTADGVQQYIMTLSTWLKAQGHDVHYLVGETKRTDIPQVHSLSRNLKVRFNRNRMSIPLPASRPRLRELLRREQFDILHVQLPFSPFLAGRIIGVAPPDTAIVGTFHIAPHSRVVHGANRMLHVLTQRSLRRFDAIMSVSPVAQSFAGKTFRIDSQVVPNTVDTKPYASAKSLSAYKDVQTILFLGRLVERKGCRYLLEAVAHMEKAGDVQSPYKVLICGKGPLEPALRRFASEKHISHLVEFVGFVDEADKPRYMASADIAIFPSTGGESFGIVLIEAMAASRGVVLAGNNPGYASVMHNHPESLFNPRHTVALADKLRGYLNDPLVRRKAKQWQRSEVQQYDVASVGARVTEVYHEALHKRRG